MPPLCGQVFKFHATLFNVAQNTKIKAANDSARREEFKTALKFFLGGLGFPQTEIEVSLTGVCPPPPLFVTFLRLCKISIPLINIPEAHGQVLLF